MIRALPRQGGPPCHRTVGSGPDLRPNKSTCKGGILGGIFFCVEVSQFIIYDFISNLGKKGVVFLENLSFQVFFEFEKIKQFAPRSEKNAKFLRFDIHFEGFFTQ